MPSKPLCNSARPKRSLFLGVFDGNRYFDVFVEYAKADVEDIVVPECSNQMRTAT
jgi:hypothetical protein